MNTPAPSPVTQPSGPRPRAAGKFVFVGREKLYIRGVTYGPFRPNEQGSQFPAPEIARRDFAQMAANGINALRTYTVPPLWLLDLARQHGLWVMIGLPWEQHVTFLDVKGLAHDIERRVCEGVRSCARHPAVLCYVIGNEIPAPIVRWHGRRRVVRFLEHLYWAAKAEDPEALFTYVNYPSTEYLQLPFVELYCFNVFLESQERLAAYLARLQNLAGDRPLILTEIGLDSIRNGEEKQASVLEWQVRTTFAAGCAGTFIFNWTDEWHRGGFDIEDWNFGLTRRDRQPKPALESVRKAYVDTPFPADLPRPRISVVVCTYNGESTLRECMEGLRRLEYPNYEVIVVNDGSTDATDEIVREYDFRVISTRNQGLSAARNIGMEAATGEIVAYTDGDCCPDPHWLTYLASTFLATDYAGVGGPNLAPPGDGPVADCVANAPGGPTHVLLSDQQAEHIPGCNMAFYRSCLQAIGGFDPQFRTAGDDVDVCWRLQERGWKLGFSPGAVVWHHRRNSVWAYWKQQKGYGKAEAQLEKKWPEKYNAAGHVTWAGRVYANGHPRVLGWASRIFHGVWGTAPFQILYQPAPSTIQSLALMPEWYLVILTLAALSTIGTVWPPLLIALPLFACGVAAPLAQALLAARRASFTCTPGSYFARLKLRGLTALLHLLQPLARLYGRLRWGLTPWRQPGQRGSVLPRPQRFVVWSEQWKPPEERLKATEAAIHEHGVVASRGGNYDRWDLEVRGGALGAARLLMAIEEHGAGKQLIRFRVWPRFSLFVPVAIFFFGSLAVDAAMEHATFEFAVMCGITALLGLFSFRNCSAAMAAVLDTIGARQTLRVSPRPVPAPVIPMPPSRLEIARTTPRTAFHVSTAQSAAAGSRTWQEKRQL
ncbi:MAG: glycosyltransferase [Acidobacteriota bacterium]